MASSIDVAKQHKTIETMNAILNNKGIVEVKAEWNGSGYCITCVDITRKLKSSEEIK